MRPISIAEYEEQARDRLHLAVWDYFSGGANDEITLRENRAAFARIQLRPRMLVDVSRIEMATTLLGSSVAMPICVAPTAMHGAACEAGECATAQAAGALGTLMAASTESTRTLEEIAQVATGPLWFQLYFSRSTRGHAERLVKRAAAAGYRAIALTADSARWARRSGMSAARRLTTGQPRATSRTIRCPAMMRMAARQSPGRMLIGCARSRRCPSS